MRVAILKSTGRIIEGQSNDDATLDILLKNAIACGFSSEDVEVKIVPDGEFHQMVLVQNQAEKTYYEKRALEYPSIGDQLDALYHAGFFPSEMTAKIAAVKNKYPKP